MQKDRIFFIALIVLILVGSAFALFRLEPKRIGDGSEYYAMYIAWSETNRPYMTQEAFDKYDEFYQNKEVSLLVTRDWLKKAFKVLEKNGKQDFPHFWFYSFLAYSSSIPLRALGIPISAHSSFMVFHLLLALTTLWVSYYYYRGIGLYAYMVVFIASPAVWFFFKVHTEYMTISLTYLAVLLLCKRKYTVAGFLLAIASTQNPTFAIPAVACFYFRLIPFDWRAITRLDVVLSFFSACVVLLHPAYYLLRLGIHTPQALTGAARISLSNFKISHIWFIDPDVGLFIHWPVGAAVVIVFAVTILFRRGTCALVRKNGYLLVFSLIYILASLLAQNSTSNINHGGTINISRYGLWYMALIIPAILYLGTHYLGRSTVYYSTLVLLTVAFVLNIQVFDPRRDEITCDPTKVSLFIESNFPWLYMAPVDIMVKRWPMKQTPSFEDLPDILCGPMGRKILIKKRQGSPLRIESNYGGLPIDPVEIERMLKLNDSRLEELDKDWFVIRTWKSETVDYLVQAQTLVDYNFSIGGNGLPFLTGGWSKPEKWGTWSGEESASITLPIHDLRVRDYCLSLEITPFIVEGVTGQTVSILVNSRKLLEKPFEESESGPNTGVHLVNVLIPEELIREDGLLTIDFRLSNPKSPRELGLSPYDDRKLGIGIISLRIKENPTSH